MRYTSSHEWVDEKTGTIGISHYAQKELGEIVYVQLPKVGAHVNALQEACVLESTKAAADVYSPVSGTVIAINETLLQDPKLINSSPENLGWLFRVKLSDPKELSSLMSEEKYISLIK